MKKLIFSLVTICTLNAHAAPTILFSGTDAVEVSLRSPSATFTIVASDTLGQEALAGAVLTDVVTPATYGSFSAGTQKGSYQMTLSYSDLVNVRPCTPSTDGRESRVLKATVYNSKGETTTVSFTLVVNSGLKSVSLADDVYSQLPAGFVNNQWIPYVGEDHLAFQGYLEVSYDPKTDQSYMDYHFENSAATTTSFSAPGQTLMSQLTPLCSSLNGSFYARGANENTCDGISVECIRTPSHPTPACWSWTVNN